jgi:hypothetical protein
VTGVDRQLVGQVAANIRRFRKPDPYKQKGGPLHRRSAQEEGGQDRSEGMKIKTKNDRRVRIQLRQRKRISGSKERPRLSVFRSVTHIYAQVIDDSTGQTLVSASTVDAALKGKLAKGVNGRQSQGRGSDRHRHRRALDRKGHQARRVRPQRVPLSRAHPRRGRCGPQSRAGVLDR